VLALPAAALSVAYPRLVASFGTQARPSALRSALLVVGIPALAGAVLVALLPGLVLTLLYGPQTFADAGQLVRILALVAGLSAFVSVLAQAALARRGILAYVPWIGAVVEVGLIELWHGSATQVALASAGALALTLVLLAVTEPRRWRGSGSNASSALTVS
jgi:hypothetical protein